MCINNAYSDRYKALLQLKLNLTKLNCSDGEKLMCALMAVKV